MTEQTTGRRMLEQIGAGSGGGRGRAVGQQCCGACNCREASHLLRNGRRGHCIAQLGERRCGCEGYEQPYAACTWPGCEAPTFTALDASRAWDKLNDHHDHDHPLCRPAEAPRWLELHPGWRPRTVYRARTAS